MDAKSVFQRTESDCGGARIGPGVYNLLIGLVLFWGFLVNWLIVRYVPYETLAGIRPWYFLGGYAASCLLGVSLFTFSKTPWVSFIGYNLVVVPFGATVNLVVHHYNPALVAQTVKITGIVTGSMMLLGTLLPVFFRRVAGAFAAALLLAVAWELADVFLFKTRHGIIDWTVAVIFCGYIGVDWGRANRIPKTVDNAVDSAAALYMDILNLFLRILRIRGRKK